MQSLLFNKLKKDYNLVDDTYLKHQIEKYYNPDVNIIKFRDYVVSKCRQRKHSAYVDEHRSL